MSRNLLPHPSVSIRGGTTLVPETIAVVTAFMKGTGIDAERVPGLVRNVHAALIDIASSSGAVTDALHALGYIPKDDGHGEVPAVADVAAVIVRPLAQLTSSAPIELRAAEPPPHPAVDQAEERGGSEEIAEAPEELPLAALPLPEVPVKDEPAAPRPVRVRKSRARSRGQLELGIVEPPLAPVVEPRPSPRKKARKAAGKGDPRKSILMDWIVCLEDGKKVRDLGSHLAQFHDMTTSEYRAKWKLSDDYPMVPPAMILKRGDQFEFDGASGQFKPLRRRG